MKYLNQVKAEGDLLRGVCLVARTDNLLRQYQEGLKQEGIGTYFIRRSEAEDQTIPGLRMAIMHRVKRLEFARVIIAGVNDGVVLYEGYGAGASDPVVKRDAETQDRALLYVSATRTRKEVLVTSFRRPSRFFLTWTRPNKGIERESDFVEEAVFKGLHFCTRRMPGAKL